jgi:hypothetical protein
VSWFASAGKLAHEITTQAGAKASAGNSWTAPAEPGPAYLWLVLRNSRGGGDFRGESIDIAP